MTYYRLIYSDNSVSAWTTDLQSLKESMRIFTRAILESKTFQRGRGFSFFVKKVLTLKLVYGIILIERGHISDGQRAVGNIGATTNALAS